MYLVNVLICIRIDSSVNILIKLTTVVFTVLFLEVPDREAFLLIIRPLLTVLVESVLRRISAFEYCRYLFNYFFLLQLRNVFSHDTVKFNG